MLIDTHVHLNDEKLYETINDTIEEAVKNGVTKMIVVGYDLESSKRAIAIAHQYPECYAAIGFHPTEIKNYDQKEYQWLEDHCVDDRVVAIGECGFDFHWDTTTKEEQLIAFVKQIEIAKKYQLPLIIHSRDAIQLTYDTLKQHATMIGGVMHSYSGSVEMAKSFIKLHFYLGISGPVTFKNGKSMKEICEKIPREWLLSETDSPYLTPHPYRGTINSPKYIPLILEEMAKLQQVDFMTMVDTIQKNVNRLFGV